MEWQSFGKLSVAWNIVDNQISALIKINTSFQLVLFQGEFRLYK